MLRARDCDFDVIEKFLIDEGMRFVFLAETLVDTALVLHPSVEIACYAHIKAARVAAHDVNPSAVLNHRDRVTRSFDFGAAKYL